MKLTTLDIINKEFKKGFSLFSYDGKEVDEFLDQVAAAYDLLVKENNQLKDENERLKMETAKYQQMERTLQETMLVAQETVRDRKDHAEREAKLVREKAEHDAKRIMDLAQVRANEMLNEAKDKVKERMKQYQMLEEYEHFFRVKFKSLLDAHLQLLNGSQIERPEKIDELAGDIAINTDEPLDDDVKEWVDIEDVDIDENLLNRLLSDD